MRNLMKLITVTVITALLLCVLGTCAFADEQIYTSPSFTLPPDRLNAWLEAQPEEPAAEETPEVPEEGEEPALPGEEEAPAAETQEAPAAETQEVPETGEEPAVPGEAEAPATEVPAEEAPAAETQETPEAGEQPEAGENPEAPEEQPAETGEEPADTVEEPVKQKRSVKVYSSQGEVVTEGEIITLTSVLVGFDDVDDSRISYQWQVDKGDDAGWVNVEGATKYKFKFIADRETIQYKWRLIVNVDE